jgi:subtilase family serine protease
VFNTRTAKRVPIPIWLLIFAGVIGARSSFGASPVKDRILQPISGASTSEVKSNVRPWARAANDQGQVSDSFQMNDMMMVFQPSTTQQADLQTYLDQLQDHASPNFHKFLTPAQFADRYGLSQNDVNKVVTWLQNEGFNIDRVARSRTFVVFSGTASQVQQAFGTAIHHYLVKGQTFYSNATDPYVPAALAGVVLGFRDLNSERPHPMMVHHLIYSPPKPRFTSSLTGDHYMTPSDFATIYNVVGLYNSGYNGSGQRIAVMEQTDIETNVISEFNSAAGISSRALPVIYLNGPDPGYLISTGDISEADLDIEYSGAIAPDATIIDVNSGTSGGAFDSLTYAIDNDMAPVISISYGDCEQDMGQSELETLAVEAEQANAEGISVLGPAGDTAAADCDDDYTPIPYPAEYGLSVDAPGSVPYVTDVGGTEFQSSTDSTTYWSSSNNSQGGSAVSYIPEWSWNDTSSTNGLNGTGGGASIFFSKPSWQTGEGVPNDGARDVPDVAVDASDVVNPYLICATEATGTLADCTSGFRNSQEDLDAAGGSSFGPPTFGAILALINQETQATTGQGNINPILYSMAAQDPDAFHNITTGMNNVFTSITAANNVVACVPLSQDSNDTGCPASGEMGYQASGPGYNQVTGLGSIDAANMGAAWATVADSLTSTKTAKFSVSASPTTLSLNSGGTGTVTVTVSPLNGFTGSVSFACEVSQGISGTTCSFNPTSVTTSGTTTLTVTGATLSSVPILSRLKLNGPGWLVAAMLALACVLLVATTLRSRRPDARTGAWRAWRRKLGWSAALALLLAALAVGSVSCGGGGSSSSSSSSSSTSTTTSTPESGMIVVTGSSTTSASTTLSGSAQVSVTVQ